MQNLTILKQEINGVPTGGLQVEVYEGTAGRPVIGANVTISGENGESFTLETDISGQTPTVYLQTPPAYLSEEPTDTRPYSIADVTVTKEGLSSEIAHGVQILPDNLSILRVFLTDENTVRTIEITPTPLYEPREPRVFEDEVKPLKPETGFVVLDRVVIPEYMALTASELSKPHFFLPFSLSTLPKTAPFPQISPSKNVVTLS